jgi:uncharacterized protein YhaN
LIQVAWQVDADGLSPLIERLAETTAALEVQKSGLDQTIGSERVHLSRMDGNARAAELAEEAQAVLARLETDVNRFARLRIASEILTQALARYREKHQGPILARSGDLFAHLTAGAFAGLRVEVSEKGDPFLVGLRPGGRDAVAVEGMSDGTADQLYLALRMAGLETWLAAHEPIPFTVDDILVNFDDERAAAALEILGELSNRTQIIFFTHHRHLVDLAAKRLPPSILHIHRLGG